MDDLFELYEYTAFASAQDEVLQLAGVEPRTKQQCTDRFELVERIRVAVVSDKSGVMTERDRDALRLLSRQLFSFDDLPEYLQGKIVRVEKDLRERLINEGLSMSDYLFQIQP